MEKSTTFEIFGVKITTTSLTVALIIIAALAGLALYALIHSSNVAKPVSQTPSVQVKQSTTGDNSNNFATINASTPVGNPRH